MFDAALKEFLADEENADRMTALHIEGLIIYADMGVGGTFGNDAEFSENLDMCSKVGSLRYLFPQQQRAFSPLSSHL